MSKILILNHLSEKKRTEYLFRKATTLDGKILFYTSSSKDEIKLIINAFSGKLRNLDNIIFWYAQDEKLSPSGISPLEYRHLILDNGSCFIDFIVMHKYALISIYCTEDVTKKKYERYDELELKYMLFEFDQIIHLPN